MASITDLHVPDRAITVRQPWANRILAGTKRHEYRTWRPGPLPRWLWLHAGRTVQWDELTNDERHYDVLRCGHILAAVRIDDVTPTDHGWAWHVGAVVPIDPVACPGRQSLWTPPPDAARQAEKELTRRCRARNP